MQGKNACTALVKATADVHMDLGGTVHKGHFLIQHIAINYCKLQALQKHITLVLAGGRPSSYFLFFLIAFFLPPVLRLLCQESREIPTIQTSNTNIKKYCNL